MRMLTTIWLGAILAIATPATAQTASVDGAGFQLQRVAQGLDEPVFLASPAGDPRLFIVEKSGTIRILSDGALLPTPFLDLTGVVSRGNEQGLLGLAFHPAYAENGQFFVNYTDERGDTQVVRYSAEGNVAVPDSATTVLTVEQPRSNHNGGWIGFGPDGLLYIGMGDGGGGGDQQGYGQNRDALLGKILRIDVDSGAPYAIPSGNPFVAGGGAPEIFVVGARNPWRIAFDGELIYVADVGQNAQEEISVIGIGDAGANLGWNVMEGDRCFRPRSGCDMTGLVQPIHTYGHDAGCSITGGYVYRGTALPALQGRYFFSDYCSQTLQSLRYADGAVSDVTGFADIFGRLGPVTSFGQDAAGELYVLTNGGDVLKLVPAE